MWTTEKPTESGLYWHALSEKVIIDAQIVKVRIDDINLLPPKTVSILGTGQTFRLEQMNGVWHGPVEAPGRS